MDTGIRSFGAFIPRRRMQRAAIAEAHRWAFPALGGLGKGERSMCSWDEDAITMAVEAGRDCLLGMDRARLQKLTLASTTAPYADLNNAVFVSAALTLSDEAAVAERSGTTRAGLTALIDACQSSLAEGHLVVASERRTAKPASTQEMQIGCGAAAMAVGAGDGLIARFLGAQTVSVPFVDHFRKSGTAFDYNWEERWIRDEGISKLLPQALQSLLTSLNRSGADITHFGLAGGPARSDQRIAKKLKIKPEALLPDLQGKVGDTGAAQPLLQLCAAFERAQPGDVIVIAAFAQGCEVAAFEMLKKPEDTGRQSLAGSVAARIEESAYLKLLSNDGHLDLEWGMRAETDNKTALTQLYRAADQIFGFVGGKCGECGAIQFPRLPACVNCGAPDSQTPYALADEAAQVATHTADWLQYSPSPPLYMGLVQFDCGARVLMEMVDVGPEGIDVGTPLSMRFRVKERDKLRGWDRYFWKAAPVGSGT